MRYSCNYGYIPCTLSTDGDPVDVLVIALFQLQSRVVVECRAVGLLTMEDEHGQDNKILAVPKDKLTPLYKTVHQPQDLPELLLAQIRHFFAHYKDLEPGKFVRVGAYKSAAVAASEISQSVGSYQTGSPQESVHHIPQGTTGG
jgi:inorganic pyrophosphatase